jgi:hypothetical protein
MTHDPLDTLWKREPRILVELGHEDQVVALVLISNADGARLEWQTGRARRVADDIVTPPEAVGTIVESPIRVSGIDTFLEKRVTVVEAIERYGELVVASMREAARRERERELDDPEEARRLEKLYGSERMLELRDPESVTIDEGREQAAEKIIEHSIEMLSAYLPGALEEGFYKEIEVAAARYPEVVVLLLYEAERERVANHE